MAGYYNVFLSIEIHAICFIRVVYLLRQDYWNTKTSDIWSIRYWQVLLKVGGIYSLYKLKVVNWAHGQFGVVLFPKNLYKTNLNQWSNCRILRLNEEGPLFDRNHRTARLSFLPRRRKPLFLAFVGGDCSLAIELTEQQGQEACDCDWQCIKNYKLTLFAFEWVHEAVSIILEMFCACFVGAGVFSIIVGQREKSVRLLLLSTSLNSSSPSSPSRRFFLPDVKKESHFILGVQNLISI